MESFLDAVFSECISRGMAPPFIVCSVSQNGSVLVMRILAGGEPETLAERIEDDLFAFPINIMIVSQDNQAARVTIEGDGKITHHLSGVTVAHGSYRARTATAGNTPRVVALVRHLMKLGTE